MKKSEFFRELSIVFGHMAAYTLDLEYLCIIAHHCMPNGAYLRYSLLEHVLQMEGISICGTGFSTDRERRYYREKYDKKGKRLPQKYINLVNFRRIFFCLLMAKHFEDQGL